MSKKKGKKDVPLAFFWTRAEARRFSDAVEALVGAVGDLRALLAEPKRRAEAAAATRRLRLQVEQAKANHAAEHGDALQEQNPAAGDGADLGEVPEFVPPVQEGGAQ